MLKTSSVISDKVYCTCEENPGKYDPGNGIPITAYTGLFGAEISNGEIMWVHAWCRKPSKAVFLGRQRRCFDCLAPFSNPWEIVCRSCFENSSLANQRRYRGWRWAARQPEPWEAEVNSRVSLVKSA